MDNVATALLFTDQSDQHTGIGKSLYETSDEFRRVIDDASSYLGRDIATLYFSKSDSDNTEPISSELMTFIYEIGIYEMLSAKDLLKDVIFTVGYKIGEYAALYASKSISFQNALSIIKKRSEICNKINTDNPSSSIVVSDCSVNDIELITRNYKLYPSEYNAFNQITFCGLTDDVNNSVEFISKTLCKEYMIIKDTGCYHTELMDNAYDAYKEVLNNTLMTNAKIEMIGNTTAKPMWQITHIFQELCNQLVEPVKWYESMEYLYDTEAIYNYIEIGPEPKLGKAFKHIHPDINVITVSDNGITA